MCNSSFTRNPEIFLTHPGKPAGPQRRGAVVPTRALASPDCRTLCAWCDIAFIGVCASTVNLILVNNGWIDNNGAFVVEKDPLSLTIRSHQVAKNECALFAYLYSFSSPTIQRLSFGESGLKRRNWIWKQSVKLGKVLGEILHSVPWAIPDW
jgi:hypothetical protein